MSDERITHPNRAELELFVHGLLDDEKRKNIESHVADCDSCCDVLRSIPHDAIVHRLRSAESSALPGETRTARSSADQWKDVEWTGIPPQLVDHPRYRIIDEIGKGGMGIVYRAEHRLMERTVALKVISRRLVSNAKAVERFRLEVRAAAKLSHRNVVAAYDAEQAGDLHFLVMEFVEGTSLREIVRRRGRLSVLHACNYVVQAAHGLQHALDNGMVHRDIKPHNLMRTPKGTVKILDFGLARFASQHSSLSEDSGQTSDGTTLGTPDYMAPEQARDARRADIRADIYSLGCTLYFLLAARVPFPQGTAIDKLAAHLEHDPQPLAGMRSDIPGEVIRIVERMMAKDPAERFSTPAEVAAALKPFGKSAASAAGQATFAVPSPSVSDPPAQNTHGGHGDAVPPLEPPGVPDIQQVVPHTHGLPPTPTGARRPEHIWRQRLRPYRVPIVTTVLALLLIALVWLFPTIRDLVATRSGGRAGAQPEHVPLATPDANGWIDLLAQVDPSRHAVAGSWHKSNARLRVDAAEAASLVLPYELPAEYDFEVTFTRNSGSDSIVLHFATGRGSASFDIDGWGEHLAGIQDIDGRSMQQNETRVENQRLANGQTYTALVRVRRSRIDAYLDGRLLTTYHGNGANLSPNVIWRLPDLKGVGIGAWNSDATFHRIRLRPASPASP